MLLDPKLWSRLPTEILEYHVLRWLPFSTLCKFRAVCKFWNTLPAVRPEEPYLLDIPCSSPFVDQLQFCYLYSAATNIWSHIDLSFLAASLYPPVSSWRIEAYCSDAGLLCVWGKLVNPRGRCASTPFYKLLVCNPLTKSWKALPEINASQNWRDYELKNLVMHRDQSSGAYKIFAATYELLTNTLHYFMYDSISSSWEMLMASLEPTPETCRDIYCSIIFEGVFYSILQGGLAHEYDLFIYDINQDVWRPGSMKIKLHPEASILSLVVSNGHLLLIVEDDWGLSINRVDMSNAKTIDVASAYHISCPKYNFNWLYGATFKYRDSIIFALDGTFALNNSKGPRVGVHLLSWSANQQELKRITPMVSSPKYFNQRWRYYRKNMKKVNFDMQATI